MVQPYQGKPHFFKKGRVAPCTDGERGPKTVGKSKFDNSTSSVTSFVLKVFIAPSKMGTGKILQYVISKLALRGGTG